MLITLCYGKGVQSYRRTAKVDVSTKQQTNFQEMIMNIYQTCTNCIVLGLFYLCELSTLKNSLLIIIHDFDLYHR